ncbi:unnamed protein product [Heligmosomoides polygyrus]|uniref:GATA-type domain-containing protein n=1 Tax=Heligmosomoides polygyrus TaxID=6339 RepID=A0A183FQR2_HELPZ|nr:unnamed protein product [Heligmosomoides polygyrus]
MNRKCHRRCNLDGKPAESRTTCGECRLTAQPIHRLRQRTKGTGGVVASFWRVTKTRRRPGEELRRKLEELPTKETLEKEKTYRPGFSTLLRSIGTRGH